MEQISGIEKAVMLSGATIGGVAGATWPALVAGLASWQQTDFKEAALVYAAFTLGLGVVATAHRQTREVVMTGAITGMVVGAGLTSIPYLVRQYRHRGEYENSTQQRFFPYL